MKQAFNPKAGETYDKRKAKLEKHANALDERLRTPQTPGQHLRPKGVIRQDGDQTARNALTQQRVNIAKELESIKKQMDKRKTNEKTKAKTI